MQGKEVGQVFFCAIEIGLQANSKIGVTAQRAFINVERGIDIIAGFHVHPDRGCLVFAADDVFEIFGAKVRRKIQAELRQLHRHFRREPRLVDAIQHLEIMLGDLTSFVAVGDIFAQVREHAAHAFLTKRLRGGEGVLESLARHKTRNAALDERILYGVFA